LGPVDHRVEADQGRDPAAERRRMVARVPALPADPRVPAGQPWHEPGRLQGHLLVGVVAPPGGPAPGAGDDPALRLVLVPRPDAQAADLAVYGAVRAPGPARPDRLVDGVERPGQADLGGAGAAGHPPGRRPDPARRPDLDGARGPE